MSVETLKALRIARRLTLEEVADRVGLSVSQISRFEAGLREPRQSEIARLADLYDVPVQVLFGHADTRGVAADLISWVSAGGMSTQEAVQERADARKIHDATLDPSGDWIALRVEGDSMDRISPPDSIIFVNLKDKRLVANACYIIADTDTGATSYKRWRPNPARFEPVSTNSSHEPIFTEVHGEPKIIGRVRRSIIEM